ncbi:GGDEF domain-containing protein [Desulfurivibrio alkaliphilus]|uniref:diguanylate cyclase n=1 Tax=Desulfurivibrio alkaliphilus (strain DSM 19089 / UNIQEM U267 / AHT2) TaxID=589865 RepID=D6Z2G2_DESAT|nr:sensor domain-containing diguanylate cyclase [Desulfurivibrio alkaliphilus]ADH85737.1 diguanylate cyclase with GAF sensor [Desulfurivibrio alkaliphilus AHT 2]
MAAPNGSFSGLDDRLFLSAQRESEALKERLLELYLLYTTSRTCGMAMQTSTLFVKIVDLLKNALGVEEFCLMLKDPENGLFEVWSADERVLAAAGDVCFRSGEGISGLVAASGQPILVQDVDQDSRFLHYRGLLQGIGSFLSVPLLGSDGQVFGVLNIHKAKRHGFREKDKEFFCAVAHNLAVALERARLFENVRKEAMHDGLTGIYNRRFFLECAERELHKCQRGSNSLSLLFIDIDHFKDVNDNFGHVFGDQVLRQLAKILQCGIRQSDIPARYGGEEFVVLLPDTNGEAACCLAEKLRSKVAEDLVATPPHEQPKTINLTVGVASYPEDGKTVIDLLRVADRRLYKGKEEGRNRVVGPMAQAPVAQAAENRRRHPRQRAALRVVPESLVNDWPSQPTVHSIDIMHDQKWQFCVLMDVSREGFNSLVSFEPLMGADYLCRAVADPRNGGDLRQFAVKVRHVEELADCRYLMGVQVGRRDVSAWHRLCSVLG